MQSNSNVFEFVNRDCELRKLTSWASPQLVPPGLIFLRAPTGIGKSSLTDQLLLQTDPEKTIGIAVDPDVRARNEAVAVFDGFFIQKTAKAVAAHASLTSVSYADIARRRGWEKVKNKEISDLVRTYPSPASLWKTAADYLERLLGVGRFSAEKLLESDDAVAIAISRDFLRSAIRKKHITLIIREAQHFDDHSLSFFLALQRSNPSFSMILEYTSDKRAFSPEHQKIIFREIDGHKNAMIFDLDFLEQSHLQYLLSRYVGQNIALASDYYAHWDGNLRTLTEIRYRIGIARQIYSAEDLQTQLIDFQNNLQKHISDLSRREQAVLVTVAIHEDEVPFNLVVEVLRSLEPGIDRQQIEESTRSLIGQHSFLIWHGNDLVVDNEDIVEAVSKELSLSGLRATVAARLRDAYLKRIEESDYLEISLFACLRRAFIFCSRTGDLSGLLNLTENLSATVARSNDQAKFVHAIKSATKGAEQFLDNERSKLIQWAGWLSYDIGNFDMATELLEKVAQNSCLNTVLYANSLMEWGDHQEAINVINKGRSMWHGVGARFAFSLSEGIVARARNQRDRASSLFQEVANHQAAFGTIWEAFALRFMETVSEFDSALPNVLRAADLFEGNGLESSAAYTRLTAAAHYSRGGQPEAALEEIAQAGRYLSNKVRDSHILLNNRACALAHSKAANLASALDDLEIARAVAGDDFSRVAAQSNSAALYSMSGDLGRGKTHAEHSLRILDDPGFGDMVVHWPILFNAIQIYRCLGEAEKVNELRVRALSTLPDPIIYHDYWKARFGLSVDRKGKYHAMLALPFHFVFLSHWQLDREALAFLQ